MDDDVPHEIKKRRLQEIIDLQQEHALYRTQQHLGKIEEFLIEGTSKKNSNEWKGRNTQNTVAVFPKGDYKLGEFVMLKVEDCTSATLKGTVIGYSDNN
jgi:tRNA-2-methylthio-N6-dimethylallyladenosine synthase